MYGISRDFWGLDISIGWVVHNRQPNKNHNVCMLHDILLSNRILTLVKTPETLLKGAQAYIT